MHKIVKVNKKKLSNTTSLLSSGILLCGAHLKDWVRWSRMK